MVSLCAWDLEWTWGESSCPQTRVPARCGGIASVQQGAGGGGQVPCVLRPGKPLLESWVCHSSPVFGWVRPFSFLSHSKVHGMSVRCLLDVQ